MKRKDRRNSKAGSEPSSSEPSEPPEDNGDTRSQAKLGSEKNPSRRVYVESVVVLDIVKKLKDERKEERLEDSHHQSRQLTWTIIAAVLVFLYTAASYWQLCETRKHFEQDQRPYIHSSGSPQIIGALDSIISSAIEIKNFGKSPAVKLLAVGQVMGVSSYPDLLKKADDWFDRMGMPLQTEYDPHLRMYKLKNGVTASIEGEMMQGDAPEPLGAEAISGPVKLPALFVGRVQYYDLAGNFYWTDLCFDLGTSTDPSGKPTVLPIPCSAHNEIH
jgi:hypothetical protein